MKTCSLRDYEPAATCCSLLKTSADHCCVKWKSAQYIYLYTYIHTIHDQGLGNIIILKDLDDKFKGNITILKDDKFNVRAVLGSTSKRRMDPPHRITESVLDEDIDIGKIIEAQVIVDKMLDTFEIVPADAQVALNDALEPISAFEKRLRTGRIFALNSSIDEPHVHPFSKSVFYQGNHARTIKEPSAKSKDVCEVLTLGLGPVLQVTRLLAIALRSSRH